MYPVTAEVMALFESEQRKVLRITGTDRNGATISITDDNVIEDSFQIDRYSCNGEKLEIGTAIAGQLTLKLENGNGQYDGIVFEGSELSVEVGIADWTQINPVVHWIPCGIFTPDEQPRRMSTISITALDRMMRFDSVSLTLTPWTTRSGIVITTKSGDPIYFFRSIRFPCTIAQIVQQAADLCGVPFTQDLSNLPNANIVISELPVQNNDITYRTLIQWCASIMGCNAWIDWTGSLRFSWYDNSTGYISTINNRYSSDLHENDLIITGVSYVNSSGVRIVEGSSDYTVDIIDNLLIGTHSTAVLTAIGEKLIGFTYRPFTAASVNAPYLWPMDVVTFKDKDGSDHTSVLTNVAFGLNGTTALESKGMTYENNQGIQPGGFTKEQAQLVNEVKQRIVDLDDSLTQEEIFKRLTDNGEEQGLILYEGKLYLNASYISAGTVSADVLKGGTLRLGGVDNGNGVLEVYDASGNTIGEWNNNGLTLNKGSIAGPSVMIGGSNNTNGVLTVKDASWNTIGEWNNNGLTLNKGSINLNNGVFSVTNAGALTALNVSLKGAFQTTGSDIRGNTINTRIASGKIRMYGSTDDGDVQSWQPHAYLYIRALGGSTPETSISAFVSDFEISCAGYLDQQAGTLTLKASDGNYEHSSERGNVTIDAADVFFTDNSNSSTPLVKIVGSSLYGGGGKYVDFNVPVNVYSSFTVASGYTKSKSVTTDQYADRLLYCYETPSPLFGDVGEAVIGDDGLCYVTIDPIFAQTITTDNYQVFLQRYGAGDCYVQERRVGWFVVAGTPGLAFGWEIKGKQADVDQRRLDRNDEKFTVPTQTYGEDAAKHIDDLRKEREAA